MLRIITDGAADIPQEWLEEFDIQIVPINIQFGDKTYMQYLDLNLEGFYKKIDETKKIPKTSQPTPHQFCEFFEKNSGSGDTILSINVTSKLSGTFDSAVAAAKELDEKIKVVTFDSATGSMGMGFMCREARKMDRDGKSMDAILNKLLKMKQECVLVLTLDTLEYARMSGRVGAMQAALASVLNIKPIAILEDGMLQMTERVRTRKASIERLLEIVEEKVGKKPVMIAILHAKDLVSGNNLAKDAARRFNTSEVIVSDLSIALAANFGPGTLGIVAIPTE